jgi:hypothetical protein
VLVRAPLVPAGLGCFVFWIRHVRVNSFSSFCYKTLRFAPGDVSQCGTSCFQ